MEDNQHIKEKEQVEEQMIQQAFDHLIDTYLHTKHRKRVEIITKAFNSTDDNILRIAEITVDTAG